MPIDNLHDGVIFFTGMLCQNAFLFKFSSLMGEKRLKTGKISMTIEATNNILVSVVKRCHHANRLFLDFKIQL